MKRTFLSILTVVFAVISAYADDDNYIYLQDKSVEQGQQMTFDILMANTSDIVGFQFDLYLPEGITAVTNSNGDYLCSLSSRAGNDHSLTAALQEDGAIRFIGFSMKNTALSGNDGAIVSLTLNVPDNTTVGNYEVYIKNNKLTKSDGSKYVTGKKTAVITVNPVGDGEITLVDGTVYEETASTSVSLFTYQRTFNNTAWQPLFLPVALNYEDWQEDFEIAELYTVNVYDDENDGIIDRTMIFALYLGEGDRTLAGVPYLIRAKSTGEKTLSTTNTKVLAANESSSIVLSTSHADYNFIGTYSGVSGSEIIGNNYYVMAEGQFCELENEEADLKPERFYLKIEERNENGSYNYGNISAKSIILHISNRATAIDQILDMESSANEVIKLNHMNIGLKPGQYSINGKKVIIE